MGARRTGLIVAGAVAVGVIGISAMSGGSNAEFTPMPDLPKPSLSASSPVDKGYGSKDASADVTLGAVDVTTYGSVKVDMTVTNHSSKRSDYWVEVTLLASDGALLDNGDGFVENLEPGQSSTQEVVFFGAEDAGNVTARIASVSRTASN